MAARSEKIRQRRRPRRHPELPPGTTALPGLPIRTAHTGTACLAEGPTNVLSAAALKMRRKLGVQHHPRQPIFGPDRFLRREGRRIVERADGEIDGRGIFGFREEQRRAATRRETPQPPRMRDDAQFAGDQVHTRTRDSSPSNERRGAGPSTIDTMAIAQRSRLRLHPITRAATEAATFEICFHRIRNEGIHLRTRVTPGISLRLRNGNRARP